MDSKWDDSEDQRALPPRRSSSGLIGLFLVLAIALLLGLVFRRLTPSVSPVEPALGKEMASLHLEPLDAGGKPLTVADLAGNVTLINFWGPWCPPCRAEFPELMKLRESLAQQPQFRLVSVTCNFDTNETDLPQQTRAFLKSQGYDLPVHRDPRLTTRQELLRLNEAEGFAYPTTMLLDQQGIVRGLWIGYHQGVVEEMKAKIDELLVEQPDDAAKGSNP